MAAREVHSRMAWLTDCGPLSERDRFMLTNGESPSTIQRKRMEPVMSIDRHSTRVFVDDGQTLDLLPFSVVIEHEVVRPHDIGL